MKRLLLVLLLVLPAAPAAAQSTIADTIAAQRAILDAAEAVLVPKGPVYTSLSDHSIKPKPAPLALGPAGFAFTDPTFGSPMWRVSDATTSAGSSIRVPSNAGIAAWNSDGTKFYGMTEGGATVVFGFDGTHVTKLNVQVPSQLEPAFSYTDPNAIYGVQGHRVKAWTLTGCSTAGVCPASDVLDLDVTYASLPLTDTYIGGLLTADGNQWATFFGGTGQDKHVFVHHSTKGLKDLRGVGWKIHSIMLERSGQFVLIYPAVDPNTGQLPGCPGSACVAQIQVWDTKTDTISPVSTLNGGHASVGYGALVNADCCSGGTWDAAQWQIRSLIVPNAVPSNLIPAVLTPQHVYDADHTNWRAARSDAKVPIVSATYRVGAGLNEVDYPRRALDEEVFAIATDGSGNIWRFAHTQSLPSRIVQPGTATTPPVYAIEFWAQPIVNVSPNGRYAIFTSNWGNATGRQDVFLVALR